jgi:hypothetical protein
MLMMKEERFKPHAQEHEEIDEPHESRDYYSPSPEDLPAHMFSHGGIAHAIMKHRMMAKGGMMHHKMHHMADGGMMEYPGKDEVTGEPHMGMSNTAIHNPGADNMTYINEHPDDDFLSDEEQTPFFSYNDRDEFEPTEKRKRMLGNIMRGLHRVHMGT